MFGLFGKPTARKLILKGIADGTFTVERISDFRLEVVRNDPVQPAIRFTIGYSTQCVYRWYGIGIDYTYYSSESWMDQMDKIKIFHAAQRAYDARMAKAKAAVDVAAHDTMMVKLTGGK